MPYRPATVRDQGRSEREAMIDYQSIPNLPTLFFDQAARRAARPFLWQKRDGIYRSLSWQQVAAAVKDLSRGLRDLGLQKGERVVLISENRPEWLTLRALMNPIMVPASLILLYRYNS